MPRKFFIPINNTKLNYCIILLLFWFNCCLGQLQQQNKQAYAQLLYDNQPTYLNVIPLSGQKKLSLRMDRIDAGYEVFSYTFQLCNKKWEKVDELEIDYLQIDGLLEFNQYQNALTQYSSYTHYKKELLEDATILRSGNYLLIVYRNGDMEDVVYQMRVVFAENTLTPTIQIDDSRYTQNETQQIHQVQVSIESKNNTNAGQYVERDISIMVVQNGSWARSFFMPPNPISTGFRKKTYGAMGDAVITSMGYYRLLNTRNLYMNADHEKTTKHIVNNLHVQLTADMPYFAPYTHPHSNLPGYTTIQNDLSSFDAHLSAEYAWIHLRLNAPPTHKEVYIVGLFNQYRLDSTYRMNYNPTSKQYEIALWLKQGSHQYTYVVADKKNGYIPYQTASHNAAKAPHIYTAIIYATVPNSTAEKVIGYASINTN